MSKEDQTGLEPTSAQLAASAKMNADTDPAATHVGGAEVSVGGHDAGHVSTSVATSIQNAVKSNALQTVITGAKRMAHEGMEPLTAAASNAINGSSLDKGQAAALTASVTSVGAKNGINPNYLVGLAAKESTFDPTARSSGSTASGLYQLEKGVRKQFDLSDADATGSSPAAITHQTEAAGGYLQRLMTGTVPRSNPDHQFEVALGYYRGNRKAVNDAMASKGGYQVLLGLNFGGESFGQYLSRVEQYK